MPKIDFLDPKIERKSGEIKLNPIPVNQYNKSIEDEKVNFAGEELIKIYRDMVIIREFETMLNEIKISNAYNEIQYNHPGPAHLSIGQEASAVGMAYNLDENDLIFGSHRSHGEILAKGLSVINKWNDNQLMDVMKSYWDGATLTPVQKDHKGSVDDLAIDFLLYGTTSGSELHIEIYDLTGTRVWSRTFQNLTPGRHTVDWDGRNSAGEGVASGVYFYRLQTDGFKQTRKMVLIR